jgi:hypothetical protein
VSRRVGPGEIYVYLMEAEGEVGIAFAETASGTKFQLVADSKKRADALRPIAEKLARDVMGRTITRARYTRDLRYTEETYVP